MTAYMTSTVAYVGDIWCRCLLARQTATSSDDDDGHNVWRRRLMSWMITPIMELMVTFGANIWFRCLMATCDGEDVTDDDDDTMNNEVRDDYVDGHVGWRLIT